MTQFNKNPTYEAVQKVLNQIGGTSKWYKTTLIPNFYVTDNVYELYKQFNAFWLGDLIASYHKKIVECMEREDDSFFIVDLRVNEGNGGYIRISREYGGMLKGIIKQDINYIDLPVGDYKFWLIGDWEDDRHIKQLTLLTPCEY